MSGRKLLAVVIALVALGVVGFYALNGSAAGKGPPFVEDLPKAERIVVASPNETAEVTGGGVFTGKVERMLRGSGTKGDELQIVLSPDAKSAVKFDSRRQYVLFLVKNKGGEGWLMLGGNPATYSNGHVIFSDAKGERRELALDDVKALITKNPYVAPPMPQRSSLQGEWALVFSEQGTDIFAWVLSIAKGDQETWQVNLKRTTEPMGKTGFDVKSFTVAGDRAEIVLARPELSFTFSGKLDKGVVYGSLTVGDRGVVPARLVPTDEVPADSLDKPQPTPGNKEIEEAFQTKQPLPELDKYIESFPDSPLVLDAHRARVMLSKQEKLSADQVQQLAESYLTAARRWGPQIELKAHLDIGLALARQESLHDLAMKHLDEAEEKFGDTSPAAWKLQTRLQKAKLLISKDQSGEAESLLKKLHADHPYEIEITNTLAGLAEKQKRTDEAIELYSELTVTPLAERTLAQNLSREAGDDRTFVDRLPSRVLARLWKVRHGDTDRLAEHLDEVYRRVVLSFVGEKAEPRKAGAGNRIALFELFTGAECPPCVAADLAVGGLEATYAQSEVIALRYHEHIPGPDPLASDITQARFAHYEGQGTPTLILNGSQVPGAGGYMEHSEGLYKQLRELVASVLEEKSDYRLELSAEAAGGDVTITAKTVSAEAIPENVRLVLVLAEDEIAFLAGNGIRSHEMVVRAMPASVEGVEPADGKLEFTKELNLAKLKASLNESLASFEKEAGIRFVKKPLDLKKLHLVAFVQDKQSKAVLQAASIPVTGDLDTTDKTEPASKKESQTEKSKDE